MVSSKTSAPATVSPTMGATIGVVKILDTGSSQVYAGSLKIWPNAQVVSITPKIGPDPAEAVIEIPIDDPQDSVGKTFTSRVHSTRGYPHEVNRFGAPLHVTSRNFLFSQVQIFAAVKELNDSDLGKPIFIGYIIDYDWVGEKDTTVMRIVLEDARHFWKKAPLQGKIFFNVRDDEVIYIRAHDLIFNAGQDPDRHVLANKYQDNTGLPMFVNRNLNRFRNDPADARDRQFISDAEVDDLFDAGKMGGQDVEEPHARKWLPLQVLNYFRLLHSGGELRALVDKPNAAVLGRTPNADDFPVDLTGTMVILPLHKKGLDKEMWKDLSEPRAVVGSGTQTGTTELVSGIGEFAPGGVSVGDAYFDVLRRVGNYTIGVSYEESGLLQVFPIRTTLGFGEDQGIHVGIRGGTGVSTGGKADEIIMPSDSSDPVFRQQRKEVENWRIKHSGRNYFNRYFSLGGRRFIQLTGATVGTGVGLPGDGHWTDHLGHQHQAYTPAGEWNPVTPEGVMSPGWGLFEQAEWIKLFDEKTDLEQYPDVFRTWIFRDNIPMVTLWNQGATAHGYRMFFERDRQIATELLTRLFEKTLGVFRSRPRKLPMSIWRAYQGIEINDDNDTVYGGPGTLNEAIAGKKRWFRLQADATPLTDGRLGFNLNSEARRNFLFPLQDNEKVNGINSPWPWNGLTANNAPFGNPRPYDMFWTLVMEVDENVYEYQALLDIATSGGMPISEFGPPMEHHRNAGNEYGEERVTNSVIDNPFGVAADEAFRVRLPDPALTGGLTTIYRDGQQEVSARNQINMNRHSMADIEGTIKLDHLAIDLQAGQYIRRLVIPGDDPINIGAIISSLHHDFIDQSTTITLSTIR